MLNEMDIKKGLYHFRPASVSVHMSPSGTRSRLAAKRSGTKLSNRLYGGPIVKCRRLEWSRQEIYGLSLGKMV